MWRRLITGWLGYQAHRWISPAPVWVSYLTNYARACGAIGYWWSEQMKYYWLLFSNTDRFDYKTNYLSTEGNVFVGLK